MIALAILVACSVAAAVLFAAGAGGLAYFTLYLLALIPGLPIGFAVFGRRHALGWIAGSALGYFFTALALWAVIALGVPSAWTFAAAWLAAIAAAFGASRALAGARLRIEPWTRRDMTALLLVLLLVPVIAGPPFARLGASDAHGNRYYRAYFTADFVWHMAVAAELKKFAMPPRNMFMPQRPLPYYWTYFLLPAAAAGAGPAPLASVERNLAVNAIGTALLFVAAIFAAAWAALPRAAPVAWGVALAVLASSAEGALALWRLLRRGAPLDALRYLNIDALSNWWFDGLRVDGLARCFWWVPQHSTSYILGLTAMALAAVGRSRAPIAVHIVSGIALGGAVALNPFVGALFAASWGIAMVVDAVLAREHVFGRILACALAAVPVVAALGWVLLNHMAGDAPSVVQFGLRGDAAAAPVRNLLLSLGPALAPAAVGLLAARGTGSRTCVLPASILATVALLAMHFIRLAVDPSWVGFRGGQIFLAAVPALAACGLAAPRWRRAAIGVLVLALIAGSPTTIIDVYNAQDISNRAPGPGFPWTEVLDPPHLEALAWLRHSTPEDAVVQLDPEARGRTTWTIVSSFGERRMAASLPRTLVDEPEYAWRSARVKQMFASDSAEQAWSLARLLQIDYLWIDEAERRVYGGGATKFASDPRDFTLVFRNDAVRIYKVRSSAAPVAPERPRAGEPVAQTDLLAFFTAPRKVLDGHFDDASAARQHAGGNLVIQLEAGPLQRQRREILAVEQLQGGHGVGQVASREQPGDRAEAASTQIRGR